MYRVRYTKMYGNFVTDLRFILYLSTRALTHIKTHKKLKQFIKNFYYGRQKQL